ncbi:Uncharacterized protein TCM_033068 [Theobroma cacao]|uniref:Uncharacterized protein n=1 Tax=Theobroma cacao TaxID=3641 RepID=A0A061FAU1_THECC|nr:Uncharacterized protein TCM_033068 [Theobroma cacao]
MRKNSCLKTQRDITLKHVIVNNQLVDPRPHNNISRALLYQIPIAMAISTMLVNIREIMWSQPCISTCGLATYINPWPHHVYIIDCGPNQVK